jgi:hypothetical protein
MSSYKEDIHMLALSTGWTIGIIVFAIIWIALAFWPARVAGRKGHSFFGYFLLSLLFFPLALIMAYMVQDRTVAVAV